MKSNTKLYLWWCFRDIPRLAFELNIPLSMKEMRQFETAWQEKLKEWEKEYPAKERLQQSKKDYQKLIVSMNKKKESLSKEYIGLRNEPFEKRKELSERITMIDKAIKSLKIDPPNFNWISPIQAVEIKKVGLREFFNSNYLFYIL